MYDEDEEERLRHGYAPAVPAAPSPAAPALAGSVGDLETRGLQSHVAPPPSVPARPTWAQYAPAEPKGWAKVGHTIAGLVGGPFNAYFNQRPEQQAEQKYKTATEEYEAPINEGEKEASTEEHESAAERDRAQAEALRHPQPKEEESGKTITTDQGVMQWNPETKRYDIKAGGAPTKENAKDEDVQDYLQANKLEDTPANREKARGAIAERGKTEAGNYLPVNDATGATKGWIDPKSRHYVSVEDIKGANAAAPGGVIPPKPTMQMRNVGAQAALVHEQMPTVISEIQQMKDELGPLEGRWNEFMQGKIGLDNPKFAGLRTDLLMMSSAVALMHARGRLPENLREEFDNAINAPKQTATNLVAVLQHIDQWTQANMGAMSGQSAGAPQAPGGATDPLGIRPK
jgi:hypothetical protein